ncbi:MAG: mandelate racemase/muconate lactonizing enzyme family protein [Verrucomicrobia bacterium]|nr:mandelate racemase/muconate lactonizing enzyme family protein [Verrucomicrobiota bacterium]
MSRVISVDAFILTVPRDEPYLGALRPGEEKNKKGYFVRKGNKTVYFDQDRTVLVRVETESGMVGWGETYGLIAPRATTEIISDLLSDFVIGRDPAEAETIHDDLYNLMRVRGYTGGFYLDALGAVDIALWDAAGREAGKSVAQMLGGRLHDTIPAYVSGLPKPTLEERVAFALEWQAKGYNSFKFAATVADDGNVKEMAGLRTALGPDAKISCDMHWAHTPEGAIAEIKAMEPYGLWFAEAPIATEDIEGLSRVAASSKTPIAVGEEWRTLFDAKLRFHANAVHIVQPEMGHTGITEFVRIARAAHARGIPLLPHATIGTGIFLAASLQAGLAMEGLIGHEFQHSIFNSNTGLITQGLKCSHGVYRVTDSPGIGVEPTEMMISQLEPANAV